MESSAEPQPILREARDGLRVVMDNRILRALAGCWGTIGLFNAMLETVWILFITRELDLAPGMIGVILAWAVLVFWSARWSRHG